MGILNQGIKVPVYNTSSTAGVLPAAVLGTGTFTIASGTRVTGTATLFTSEVKNGDYLHSSTLNEVRTVKHVLSDTLIELKKAFSAPVAGADVNVVRKQDISNVLQLGFVNSGATDATVDEDILPATTSTNFSDEGGVGPITFDGTGTVLGISQKLRG